MGFATVVAAVISGAGAFAAGTTFFGLSVLTSSLLVAGAVGLGLNYLRNITPGVPSQAPQDFDFRVSRPAATTPARFLYGRARFGGHPVYLDEFEYDDDAFVGYRDYQVQVLLVSEGQCDTSGMLESLWLNGRRAPYNPSTSGRGQINTSGRNVGGRTHYVGSNTHLDADIALWEARKTTVRGALTDPDNPPRGVDILLGHIQERIDDLVDRRGRRQQFIPNSTFVGPEDGFQWEDNWQNTRGVETNIRVFEHHGQTDRTRSSNRITSRLWSWKRRTLPTFTQTDDVRGTIKWDPDTGQLKGISALMLELRDPGPRREAPFLTSAPRTEYLCRGRMFTWPGQTTPAWTENAAAIYYDWLVTIQGIDPDTIDEPSFTAAYDYCNERVIIPALVLGDEDDDTKPFHANDILTAQFGDDSSTWPATAIQNVVLAIWNDLYTGDSNAQIRYSINGIVSTDMDPREVEKQFNAAWGGYAVERGGKIYFEPGRDKAIGRTLTEAHIVEGTNPSWQIEPPLQQRTTSVTATLAQSEQHDWLSYSMPKIALDGVEDDYPRDLGTWTYVAYPTTASRLMRQALFRANGGKAASLTVSRGDNWAHYGISPTDRVALDLPTEGHDDTAVKWFVDRAEVTMEGTVNLDVRQERSGTYDDAITVPLEIGAAGRTGFGFGATRSPPQNVTWVRTGIRETEHRDSENNLYTVYRQYWEPRVDGEVPTRRVVAEYVHRRVAGQAVPREGGTPPRWGQEIEGVDYFPRYSGNPFDFYMLTRVPVLPITVDQPHGAFNTSEVELRLRYDEGGFQSRWSEVVVVDLSPPVSIPDGLLAAGS